MPDRFLRINSDGFALEVTHTPTPKEPPRITAVKHVLLCERMQVGIRPAFLRVS